jgi:hypothetical protein
MYVINKFSEEQEFRTLCLAIVISGTPIVFDMIKGQVTEFDVMTNTK